MHFKLAGSREFSSYSCCFTN